MSVLNPPLLHSRWPKSVSKSSLYGNVMEQNHVPYTCCGKPSGLDDLVRNSLELGIHSNLFILDALIHGPKADSPAHELTCSGCGTQYAGMFNWTNVPDSSWRD